MKELFEEIYSSVRKNKLRTVLTGFSIAWGIFMLSILLGSGNGLMNASMANFGNMLINTIEFGGGRTSMAYKGYGEKRSIALTERDAKIMLEEFPEVSDISMEMYQWGGKASYGNRFVNCNLCCVNENYALVKGVKLILGRTLSRRDNEELRKVIVIDDKAQKILFPSEDPLGKDININNTLFKVVGVVESIWSNQSLFLIPLRVGVLVYESFDYNADLRLITVVKGLEKADDIDNFENRVVERLSVAHQFDPEDKRAIWHWNNLEEYKNMLMVFNGLNIFIWFIGLGTLMAGVVGVSNIMLVTVRERTFEFGIRKALGAKPSSIIRLILYESVIITSLFGYIGMVLGIGVMELVNNYMVNNPSADGHPTFLNPTLDLSIMVSATVVLVVAGMVAGYVPARPAARLKTIDALRFNK